MVETQEKARQEVVAKMEKARQELSEHLEQIAVWLQTIDEGFTKTEMSTKQWRTFARALFDFADSWDYSEYLFKNVGGEIDGLSLDDFGGERESACVHIRISLFDEDG